MIHVIATIELHEGQREAFLEEFRKVVPKVHAETGCREYGPTIDVATDIAAQIPNREHLVTIVEKWESLDALKAHLTAAHMTAYRERVKDMVKSVQIQVLRPVSSQGRPTKKRKRDVPFTYRQGQFLAFIHLYRKLYRRGPSELDIAQYFRLTPPSAHGMVVKLEQLGLITKEPGVARSIRVAVSAVEIPDLEDAEGPS